MAWPSVDELERLVSQSNNTRTYPSVDELEKAVRNSNTQQAYIPAPEIPIDVPQDEPVPGFITNVAKDISKIGENYLTGVAQSYQERSRASDAAGQAFVNTLTRQGTLDDYWAAREREGRADRQFVKDTAGTPAIVGALMGIPGAGVIAGPIVARDIYDAAKQRYDSTQDRNKFNMLKGEGETSSPGWEATKQVVGDVTGIGPASEEAPRLITPEYWEQAYTNPVSTLGGTAMALAPAALIGKGAYKASRGAVDKKVSKALDEFDFTQHGRTEGKAQVGFAVDGLSKRDFELTDLPEYSDLLSRLKSIGEKKWDAAELNINSRSSFDYTNVKNPEKTTLAGDGILLGDQSIKQPGRIILPRESMISPEGLKAIEILRQQSEIDAQIARQKGDPYQMFMDTRNAGDYYRAARWAEILGSKDWAEQYRKLWWKGQGFKDNPAIDLKRVQPTLSEMRPEINQFMADTTQQIASDRTNVRQGFVNALETGKQRAWDSAEAESATMHMDPEGIVMTEFFNQHGIAPEVMEKSLRRRYEKLINDQVNILRSQMKQGTESGVFENSSGDLFTRNYSKNYQWYRDMLDANGGKFPKKADLEYWLRETAIDQLRKGSTDPMYGEMARPSSKFAQIEKALSGLSKYRKQLPFELNGWERNKVLPEKAMHDGAEVASVLDNAQPSVGLEYMRQPDGKRALANGYRTQSGRSMDKASPEEFIVRQDGSTAFGEITSTIAAATNGLVKPGEIRLQVGWDQDGRGYGLAHIKKREAQLHKLGYNSAEDFVTDVARNFDRIHQESRDGRILLVRSGDRFGTMPVDLELVPVNGTPYYTVVTALPVGQKRQGYVNKKPLLFERSATPSPSSDPGAASRANPQFVGEEAQSAYGKSNGSINNSISQKPSLFNDGNKEFMAAPGMSVPTKSQRLDTPTGGTVTGTVTRRQIVEKIDEMFTKVRSGRVGMRGVLGWFNRDSEVIRTKDYGDFRTIMHEIGHYLDKGLELRNDSRFDGELLGAVHRRFGKAYDDLPLANKRGEGIAEFIHDYTIDPAMAQREFPGYFAAFEQRLAQEPVIKAQLDEVRQQLHIWNNQAAEARGRGAITRGRDRKKKSIMEQARDSWFNFRKTVIDDKVGLSEFVVEFEKLIGRKLSFDENPYLQSRMALSSATARAQMVVENKSPALTREVLNKVYGVNAVSYDVTMRSILNKLENNKELAKKYPDYLKKGNFEDWTAALDTYLVAQRQIELQKLNPDYKGVMNPSDAKTIVQGAPVEVAQAAKEFYKYNDNLLRIEVVGGLISPETYVNLTAKHKVYASMVRDFANEDGIGYGGSRKSFGNVKSSLKSLRAGSLDNVQSPIETAIIRTYDVFNRVERNKVAQTFAKLAQQSGVGRLVENVQGKARASEYVFTVMERGIEKAYETTPETYRAIMSMNQESSNILIKILSVPAGWLRAGATLTPDFIFRNLGRDTFSAAVYSKHGFVPIFDTIKGLSLLMNDPKLYAEYRASGAQMATLVSMDRNYISQSIDKLVKNNMISKANPIEWLRAFSDAAETATRLAEFKKAREAGKSIQEAGLEAKDITVDFNRAGTAGRKFNQMSAFFNAAIQGTDRMARAFKEDPIGFNMRALMWVTMPSIALWLINHGQEWYREEPDWVKNTCWMFKAGDTIYRMPKPPGLGQIYGSSVETALDYFNKQDSRRVKAWAKTTLDNLLPGIGVTAVEPIIENVANYSFFRDRPIVPQHEQNWSPDQQFGPYTSEAARFVGRQLNVSPRKVDNLIQGYTASMGKMVSSGIDYAAGKYENLPEQQIENLPGLRSVMSRPFQSSQSVQDFYEEYREQKELHSKMEQTGVVPKDYDPQRYAHLKSIDKDMSQIRKREKQVMNSNMTPREKRDQLDKLQREAIDLAQGGLWRPKIAQ